MQPVRWMPVNPRRNKYSSNYLKNILAMKKFKLLILLLFSISIFSCKKDDDRSCLTCSSPVTESFQLCQESDGSASVNGQNTGTIYDEYLSRLQEEGAECGR